MSGAVSIRTSNCIPPNGPARAEGVRTGSEAFPRMDEKSVRGLKPVRITVIAPDSMLRWVVPRKLNSALAEVLAPSGYRTRTFFAVASTR